MVKNTITVFARLKPEKRRKEIVNHKIHRRPKKHLNEDFLVLTAPQKLNEYIDNRPESWNFSFYRIFGHDTSQNDVFESVARPVVNSVFDGYNATIFAYGQTGSGKTYTITGEPERHGERGILPRTLQYIFDTIRKNPENLYSVEIAYLEIYNENGYDLLLERDQREAATRLEDLPRVTIQEDENNKMHLKNLSFRIVENESEALKYLIDGDMYRAISETPMNPRSSRSHCIFTIVVSVKKFGADRYTSAKMHLVDLAGSERVYKCAIQGTTLTEAKHINLSLHFLEQVIVCLGQENASHIPYRNSLLTSILRDSLGGNCLTTMLATLSVSNFNLEETISTCRFAQRVALVKNDVNLSFELDTRSENKLLKMENERLRKQIEELKKQNNSELSLCSSSTGSLEYYKNLVIQRDEEISHLIEMLKKEKARRESFIKESPAISIDNKYDEKSIEIPSSRLSPKKIDRALTKEKIQSKSSNSLQEKIQTSPKRSERISPERHQMKLQIEHPKLQILKVPTLNLENDNSNIEKVAAISELRKKSEAVNPEKLQIKLQNESPKSQILKVSTLNLKNDNSSIEKVEDTSELRKNRKTPEIDKNIQKIVQNKVETIETIEPTKKQIDRDTQTPRKNTFIPSDPTNDSDKSRKDPQKDNSPEKNPPTEKSPDIPRNFIKMMKTSQNRQINEETDENSHLSSILESPKSSFKKPNIPPGTPRKNKNVDKIDENLRKSLPLTGDPEIDEEIIAFYKAKRGGGSY